MTCPHCQDLLPEYLEGTLAAEAAAAAELHLAQCRDCQTALQQMRALGQWIERGLQHDTARLTLSAGARQRILRAARAAEDDAVRTAPTWSKPFRNPFRLIAASAVFAVVVAIFVQVRRGGNSPAAGAAWASYQVDVPFQGETHVFQAESGTVIDAVVPSRVIGRAHYSSPPLHTVTR